MAQRLFADDPRSDSGKRRQAESKYAFLDRCADPAISRVRDLVEDLFTSCSGDRRDLHGRLASKKDGQFDGAFFELYLDAVHRSLGFTIETHPTHDGVSTHADFRATRADEAFLLEATSVESVAREPERPRARVVDAIDAIESPDFKLRFEIEKEGTRSPAMRDVVRRVRAWLDELEWAETWSGWVEHRDPALLPYRKDHARDWTFSFWAWPCAPEDRGRRRGSISVGASSGGGADDHDETLRSRLERKAKRYGTALGEPFVLAIRLDRTGTVDRDVAGALHGPAGGRGEGLWRRDGEPRNRHVSAVLVCDAKLRPENVSWNRPTLWGNPTARRPLPALPWDRAVLGADGEVVRVAGAFDPAAAFALPGVAEVDGGAAGWPGMPYRAR